MHEGWEYVAATYGIIFGTLGVWFWMILAKLARLGRTERQPTDAGEQGVRAPQEPRRG